MRTRRLIATLAQKGGVGKTFLAKVFHDLLPVHGRSVASWDLDAATGTFAVYDDAIKTFDLTAGNNTESWLDDCHRDDVDDVIIDVPGGRIDDLLKTFGDDSTEALVSTVLATGRELVVATPIGVMIAETVTAQVVLNAFAGTPARIVIVQNGRFGSPADFIIYNGLDVDGERRYGATSDLAERLGAETLYFNAFSQSVLAQVDAERLRLIEAAGPAGSKRLGRLASTRLQINLHVAGSDLRGSSLDLDGVIPERDAKR
ncbi:MAG: hypothetical protein KGN02_01405 [bacterium]|nr:hypothetical protein [bacterium]